MRQIRGRKGRGRRRGGARGRDYSYIVAAQDADDLAAAVQLDKQSLIEVLECSCFVVSCGSQPSKTDTDIAARATWKGGKRTFFNSGCAGGILT